MARINITLKANERDALRELAEREFRDPRAQAALIIRRELGRMGLLPFTADKPPAETAPSGEPPRPEPAEAVPSGESVRAEAESGAERLPAVPVIGEVRHEPQPA
jgi:hypothetical protein